MNLFLSYLWKDPRFFFTMSLLVIFSVTCHEFFHAWCALKVGDSTAADTGHLTFNPFRQMGPVSLLMLMLIGFCWGAVPVDPRRMRGRYAPALVAAAGPAANFVLAILFVALSYLAVKADANRFACQMLFRGAILNFALFLFNLLPIPGLDGFTVLCNFFPRLALNSSEAVRGTFFVLIVLAITFIGTLFRLAEIAAAFLLLLLQRCFG